MIKLSGSLQEFQWKITEQVYPFEKGKNGETLYCKRFDISSTPNGTWTFISHGISSFTGYRIWGNLYNVAWANPSPNIMPVPMNINNSNLVSNVYADQNSIGFFTSSLLAGYTAEVFFIYSKS